MPVESSLPPLDIPNVGIWDFLFERKELDFPADKVIFTDSVTRRSYTYQQVKDAAIDFGKGLKALWEWRKGEVLALYTPNSVDTPAIMWGCHWAGGVVSPANPGYSVSELAFQLKDSGASAICTQWDFLETARQAAQEVGIPDDRVILMGDKRDSTARHKHFTSIRNISGATRYRRTKTSPDTDLAFIVYSSGTTGLPKGVKLSHRNIIANVLQNACLEGKWLSNKPRPGFPDGDVILCFLPFFHIYGLTVVLHQALYSGYKTVAVAKFDIESWCRSVQEEKVTFAFVVPPVVLLLSKHPVVDKYDLSSIRMMNSGAAPLTKELVNAVYKRKGLKVKQGYGLSETSPTTHLQPWDRWDTAVGSVGLLLPNQTARFMSPEEKEVPVGDVGELWIKGPNIFQGYLNNVEGTRNALTEDGFFKTGDVGYQDADGNYYITDRVKELIKYSGFQVAPAELEGLLLSHDKISDVAVMGVFQQERASEVPLAFVVPNKDAQPGPQLEKEIVDWLASRTASHKKLRGGVIFTNEIPKSASGKILRRILKAKYEEESKSQTPKAKL